MKKSLMWFLSGALLAAVSLAMSARAQSNVVYAVEFNQSPNRFGTIDLWTGNFTQIATVGTLINDLAYCPTNGMLYGILNSTTLVTFNETNGAMTSIGNFNVGIQSLAFRPSDGVLFGATQTGLYTINPATGAATPVGSGSFGSPPNLNSKGQNIRFAQDGNLYISNTSSDTDIYRISTTDGSATWMGEAVGIPYLMLMNGDNYMYGVYINLGSSSGPQNILASFDLTSFVEGGTNANGSIHQISIARVGAGTNFPINFIFSGGVSQPVTNLTVPVSAVGPSDQTAVVGSNVVFSTAASGTGPYNYAWSKNGAALNGQTNSSLTLNSVTTNDAATYSVIVGGEKGTVTNSATLTVNVPVAVTVPPADQTTVVGSNAIFSVTATGTDLSFEWLFNDSVIGTESSLTLNNVTTSQAGVYTVIVNGAAGSVTNNATLTVNKADATVTLGNLNQLYDGTAKLATAGTTPSGLAVVLTYNGSANAPTNAGSYTVIGTINDANYQGSTTNTLVISQASGVVTLGSLSQTYDGTAKLATAGTTPSGLAVVLTYNGSANAPTNVGSYTVIGTINDANYQGSATNTLVISPATGVVTLGSLSQTYDGTAKAATAGTTPSGLTVALTYNGSANAPTNAGSYTVIGTINDANYQGGATNPLVIAPVTLTVTADNKTKIYGMPNPPLTASYNGFVGGQNTNALSSPVVLSTTATNTSGAGEYPITASGAAAANYTIQYVNGTLRVISAPQLAIAGVSVDGTEQYVVSWQTITNQMYQLEYTADLDTWVWTPLGTPFAGTDGIVAVTNAMNVMPNCFFRVEVQ
jgi:hypothetical protein